MHDRIDAIDRQAGSGFGGTQHKPGAATGGSDLLARALRGLRAGTRKCQRCNSEEQDDAAQRPLSRMHPLPLPRPRGDQAISPCIGRTAADARRPYKYQPQPRGPTNVSAAPGTLSSNSKKSRV